jgi:hypothetical protein
MENKTRLYARIQNSITLYAPRVKKQQHPEGVALSLSTVDKNFTANIKNASRFFFLSLCSHSRTRLCV